MQLKSVTWNIGGGKYLKDGENPLLMASYSVDAIQEIAQYLKDLNPDIITLQEAQGDDNSNQVEQIARLMGYQYHLFDATSSSHIDTGMTLGNGIISKHPITNHQTGMFLNPNVEIPGKHIKSHDKGYSTCTVDVNGYDIHVTTLHLLPFGTFGIDLESEMGKKILTSVSDGIATNAPRLLIQGDFNIDTRFVTDMLPSPAIDNLSEVPIDAPTTPFDGTSDHILFKGFSLVNTTIDSTAKTDHYPITCTFEVNDTL